MFCKEDQANDHVMIKRQQSSAHYQYLIPMWLLFRSFSFSSLAPNPFLSQPAGSGFCCARKVPLNHVIEVLLPHVGGRRGQTFCPLTRLGVVFIRMGNKSTDLTVHVGGSSSKCKKRAWWRLNSELYCRNVSRNKTTKASRHKSWASVTMRPWSPFIRVIKRQQQRLISYGGKNMLNLIIIHQLIPICTVTVPPVLWITRSLHFWLREGLQDPITKLKIHPTVSSPSSLGLVFRGKFAHQVPSDCSFNAWKVNLGFFFFSWFTPGCLSVAGRSWCPRGKARRGAGWNAPSGRSRSCQ